MERSHGRRRPPRGAPSGALVSFSIGRKGDISGIYSNGVVQTLGQMAVASVPNAGGLQKLGSNLYTASASSGAPLIGVATEGARGEISSGMLEASNVDLAQQFTSMIVASRGFQANSRIITTSDELLQDLVNLKR